jgi:hypothetical protein
MYHLSIYFLRPSVTGRYLCTTNLVVVWNFRVEIHSFLFSPAELTVAAIGGEDEVPVPLLEDVCRSSAAVSPPTGDPGGGKLWLLRSRRRGTSKARETPTSPPPQLGNAGNIKFFSPEATGESQLRRGEGRVR